MEHTDFERLAAAGYNRVPVWRSVLADLDTPLSVYLKLADGPNTYLLESVEGGENWGRYSIIGLPCRRSLELREGVWQAYEYGRVVDSRRIDDPLEAVRATLARFEVPSVPELPRFCGGLVGYFGYETVGFIEPRLAAVDRPDALGLPDIRLLLSEELAVFDNLTGRLYLVINVDPRATDAWPRAQRRLDQLQHRLRCGSPGYARAPGRRAPAGEPRHGMSRKDFERAVERIKDYIERGDCMQVVLSQRMTAALQAAPVDVYRALRALNPSPYLFFFDFGDSQVVGSSPEVLVRVQDRVATLRPIAGTRPRGATADEDARLADELLADPKERAEHLMLIDLGRNDLGRVAATGSVEVVEQMIVERYSHVMHIVSEVRARLRDDLGAVDALRAAFPAGTLSGAPKVRAMEIIAELEPVKRNVYAGAVGWLNWWDEADLAIAIRTGVIADGKLHLQAGAGVVADSDPAREWEETLNKGRALLKALSEADSGL